MGDPVFFVGLYEDLTACLSPLYRATLLASASVISVIFSEVSLQRVDIILVDGLLSNFGIFSALLTAFIHTAQCNLNASSYSARKGEGKYRGGVCGCFPKSHSTRDLYLNFWGYFGSLDQGYYRGFCGFISGRILALK